MERAIEFLLKSQASAEARIERTNVQQAEAERRLGQHADILATFIQVVTNTFAEQAEINRQQVKMNRRLAVNVRRLAVNIRGLTETVREQAAAQSRTDGRLNALIDVVERQAGAGGHGQAP